MLSLTVEDPGRDRLVVVVHDDNVDMCGPQWVLIQQPQQHTCRSIIGIWIWRWTKAVEALFAFVVGVEPATQIVVFTIQA